MQKSLSLYSKDTYDYQTVSISTFWFNLFFGALTHIGNISRISPSVIHRNKIQKSLFVTGDVTYGDWTVASYVVGRVLVGVYVHDVTSNV